MDLQQQPGLLFVAAALLPLLAFALIALQCVFWALTRRYQEQARWIERAFEILGGSRLARQAPAFVALAAIVTAFGLSAAGFVRYTLDHRAFAEPREAAHLRVAELQAELRAAPKVDRAALRREMAAERKHLHDIEGRWEARRASAWQGRFEWLRPEASKRGGGSRRT